MPQSLYCVCRTTPPLSRCLLSKCWGLYTLAEKYAVLWAVKLTRTEDGSLSGSVCPDSHLPSAPSDSRGWTKQKTMKAGAKATDEQASWRLFQGPHRIQQTLPLKAPRCFSCWAETELSPQNWASPPRADIPSNPTSTIRATLSRNDPHPGSSLSVIH